MKYTVTPQNIKSVAKMIEKLAKNKSLVSQMFYPTAKKESTILKAIGINRDIITRSMIDIFNQSVIEVDFMNNRYFIRVHNNDRTESYGYSNYRGFCIYCGDFVEFKNNIIHLRRAHPTDKNCKANEIIKFV